MVLTAHDVSLTVMTVRRGTLLYRSSDFTSNLLGTERFDGTRHVDGDTGKIGLYFATYPLLSVAMAAEAGWRRPVLGVFEVTRDIPCIYGKYAFRELDPTRFFDEGGNMIFGVGPSDSINHFDDGAGMILDREWNEYLSATRPEPREPHGEVFLGEDRDDARRSLRLVAVHDLMGGPAVLRELRKRAYMTSVGRDDRFEHDALRHFIAPETCGSRRCRYRRRSDEVAAALASAAPPRDPSLP